MATVGRKDNGCGGDGAGLGFEFSVEKLVKTFVRDGGIEEIGWIHAVMLDEWLDSLGGFAIGHAFAIPFRKTMALHQGVEREFSERISVGPAQERFSIYLLGFLLLSMAVEISDAFHIGRKPFVDMKVKEL